MVLTILTRVRAFVLYITFLLDCIFFTVPSLDPKPTTLFGVACYRQIDVNEYSSKTPDLTRNSVQKSVVFLSSAALFGLISTQLNDLTDAFVAASSTERGYEILRSGFADIQTAVDKASTSPLYETELLRGLSAVSFVRAYQRDALVLLKLLLLERKILFACDTTVNCLSTWLLTLVSLIPGMLDGGLAACTEVDDTWVRQRACWPLATLSQGHVGEMDSSAATSASAGTDDVDGAGLNSGFVDEDMRPTTTATLPEPLHQQTRVAALRSAASNLWSSVTKTASALSAHVRGTNETPIAPQTNTVPTPNPAQSTVSAHVDPYAALPPLEDDGCVLNLAFPTDDWGLPLPIFSRSYLFLPYVPLHALDMLLESRKVGTDELATNTLAAGRRVRGFLCGTTNPLLSQNTRLAEVIVQTLPLPAASGHVIGRVPGGGDVENEAPSEATGDPDAVEAAEDAKPSMTNRSSGVLSKLMNRQPPPIRLCPPSEEASSKLRSLPIPLARAAQLSRLDRVFIDHLVHTAELWYASRALQQSDPLPAPSLEVNVEEGGSREPLDAQACAEVLSRFPELADLERWIRAQFGVYVKSLLLTAEGRGGPLADFNLSYIACLRTTHAFLAWRSQLVVSSIASQLANDALSLLDTEANGNHNVSTVAPGTSANIVAKEAAEKIYAISSPLLHPGKHFPSSDATDQIVTNLKQFGNLAADHGRRVMNQWVNGFLKLGNFQSAKSSR
uniref:UDENN domain-containing protein n=1 Tax=Mesocestoides corti TaxID=53468 RepID=A0A5K3FFK1_MESCO